MAARNTFLIVAAIFVGYMATEVIADGRARQPNIIERIMGPIVRQIQLSQIGGPMKQPLLDGSPLSVTKLRSKRSPQSYSASRQIGDNAHRQPGNNTANNDSFKSRALPGKNGSSHEVSGRHPPTYNVVVTRGSRLPGPLSANSSFTHEAPGVFRYIRHFLSNFMAAPPLMNPDFMPPPLPPIVAGPPRSKKADKKANSSVGKDVGRIGVHYEASVLSNVKRNASVLGKSSAAASAGNHEARSPPLPSRFHTPSLNRNAFRSDRKRPGHLFSAAGRKAAAPRASVPGGGVGNLHDSKSFSCICCGLNKFARGLWLNARLSLLLGLLMTGSILLGMSLYTLFTFKKLRKVQTKCVDRLWGCTEGEGRGVIKL